MEVQPVMKSRKAGYPTNAGNNIRELEQRLPRRWAANPKLMATLAIVGGSFQSGWTREHSVTPGLYPPQYMTESDAVAIAKELSARADLTFKLNSKKIPITIQTKDGKTKKVDFVLDLYDEKVGVGFECLSLLDCYDVYGYETKVTPQQLARTISKSLNKADRAKIKIITESGRTSKAGPKKEREQLMTELKAFFDWLKKEGVI